MSTLIRSLDESEWLMFDGLDGITLLKAPQVGSEFTVRAKQRVSAADEKDAAKEKTKRKTP